MRTLNFKFGLCVWGLKFNAHTPLESAYAGEKS